MMTARKKKRGAEGELRRGAPVARAEAEADDKAMIDRRRRRYVLTTTMVGGVLTTTMVGEPRNRANKGGEHDKEEGAPPNDAAKRRRATNNAAAAAEAPRDENVRRSSHRKAHAAGAQQGHRAEEARACRRWAAEASDVIDAHVVMARRHRQHRHHHHQQQKEALQLPMTRSVQSRPEEVHVTSEEVTSSATAATRCDDADRNRAPREAEAAAAAAAARRLAKEEEDKEEASHRLVMTAATALAGERQSKYDAVAVRSARIAQPQQHCNSDKEEWPSLPPEEEKSADLNALPEPGVVMSVDPGEEESFIVQQVAERDILPDTVD